MLHRFGLRLRGLWSLLVFVAAAPLNAAPATTFDGLIEPSMTIELRSPIDGVIDSVAVDRGDAVKRGQVLVRLRSKIEQAQLAIAEVKAELEARKQMRATELLAQNAIPVSAKEEADALARLSDLELRRAREALNQRVIVSPINGVVAERYLSPGESVKDRTILKLVQIDPLRVEVVLPAGWFGQIRKGMRAEVKPEIESLEPQVAKVTVVDKVMDPASGTFGARLSISNPDYALASGLRCTVRFLPD